MTSNDSDAWKAIYSGVCVAYNQIADREQSKIYFRVLRDCDLDVVRAAAGELVKGSKWFPKAAEWRQACGAIIAERRRERARELAGRRLTPEIHCDRCHDTGMRESDNDPSRYTHCECRDQNPNYLIGRAKRFLADPDSDGSEATIPPADSSRLLDKVHEFKRLSGGDSK